MLEAGIGATAATELATTGLGVSVQKKTYLRQNHLFVDEGKAKDNEQQRINCKCVD